MLHDRIVIEVSWPRLSSNISWDLGKSPLYRLNLTSSIAWQLQLASRVLNRERITSRRVV